MVEIIHNKKFKTISLLFSLIVLVLMVVTFFKMTTLEYIIRLFCIPIIMILYYVNSLKKSKLYLFSLVIATGSNILFISENILFLKYGLIAFLIYRIITLYIVIKYSPKLSFFSVIIGSVFFLFPLLYFIVLIEESMGESFFAGLVNILLVSILGGMTLANYLMESNFKHISLLTSTLLYTLVVLLFVIQKYFIFILIFDPLRVIVLMAAHYFFCLYVMIAEDDKLKTS
jgi:hypothetical protein